MPDRTLFKELLILVGVSVVVALLVNGLSPRGIPLMGNWDPADGKISGDVAGPGDTDPIEGSALEKAKEIFDRGDAVFVDARSRESYRQGHIAGAVSLPPDRFQEEIQAFQDRYDFSTPMVTYCSGPACRDSHFLAQLLGMAGYGNVRVFVDGFPAWKERGYPCE